MNVAAFSIAPVRKTIRVAVAPNRAFDVFTRDLPKWWPATHKIVAAPLKETVFEPRLGGRWYQVGEDGAQALVGKVLVWEPAHRVVVSWLMDNTWKGDAKVGSEIEVRFVVDGEFTRVELEHRNFEVMGAEAGTKMRNDVDGGWPAALELYRQAADKG